MWRKYVCIELSKFVERTKANLAVSLDIWDVFEERNDNGEDQHEADRKQQGPGQSNAGATQCLLHVKVKAQLHHNGPVYVTQAVEYTQC